MYQKIKANPQPNNKLLNKVAPILKNKLKSKLIKSKKVFLQSRFIKSKKKLPQKSVPSNFNFKRIKKQKINGTIQIVPSLKKNLKLQWAISNLKLKSKAKQASYQSLTKFQNGHQSLNTTAKIGWKILLPYLLPNS